MAWPARQGISQHTHHHPLPVAQPLVALLTTRTLLLFNAALTLAVLVNLLGCLWWNLVRFLQAD